jgi:hypothetical protein
MIWGLFPAGAVLQNVQTGKVNNKWCYTSASFICLHGVESENFTLTFLYLAGLHGAVNVRHVIQTFD